MTNKTLAYSILILFTLKIAAIYFTDFNLYGDEAQYWLWAQDLDIGYYSKPPLLAWFLYGYSSLFGDSFFSLKTFPIIVYFFILIAVYKLCTSLSFSKKNSLLCAVSFLIIPAASFSSFLISTDLLLLLFWTLSMVILLKIRNGGDVYSFLLLGLFLGLAFLAKYAAVYFLLSLLILMIIDNKIFNIFKKNSFGIIVFLLSFVLVLSPNIVWNLNNGWVTLAHTSDNADLQNLNINFYEPLKFLSSQILMVGPVLFFSFIFFLKYFHLNFENKFLLCFSLPILFIVLIEGFLVRANANWAAPALISIFVMLFKLINNKSKILIKINFIFNYIITFFLFSSILVSSNNQIFNRITGLNNFTKEVLMIVNDKDLVISDRIIFSNISYEARNTQNNFYMPYKAGTNITNHFQISSPLSNLKKNNFFLIGGLDDISYLSKKNQISLIKEFDVPFSSNKLKLYEVSFK